MKKQSLMLPSMESLKDEQDLLSKVPLGAIFRHYKGKEYKILHIGRHAEDLSLQVVYQSLYDSKEFGNRAIWIRPLKMFTEEVEIEGKRIPRFAFVKSK